MIESRIDWSSESGDVESVSRLRPCGHTGQRRAADVESSIRVLKRMLWRMQESGVDHAWEAQMRGGEA